MGLRLAFLPFSNVSCFYFVLFFFSKLLSKISKPKEDVAKMSTGDDQDLDSPSMAVLRSELEEEKRKRAMIAQEAAATEEVVRNALTAANARVEDIEARRLELSAELRAAQAASQIFETERFDMLVSYL